MPQSASDIAQYGDRSGMNAANAAFQQAQDAIAAKFAHDPHASTNPDFIKMNADANAILENATKDFNAANPDKQVRLPSQGSPATPDNRGLGNFTGTTNPNGSGVALDSNGNAQTNNGQPVQPNEVGPTNQPNGTSGGLKMPAGYSASGLQMPTGAAANTVFDPISGKQVSPAEAALNAKKASGEKPPQDSSNGVSAATSDITKTTPPQPQTGSTPTVDNFLNKDTNPTIAQQVDAIMAMLSPQATTDNLNKELAQIQTDKTTLAGLQTDLMNINNVMSGSETDIRNEIQAAGGMATNSQVMALASARNKTLLQQAKLLQEQITTQTNTVNSDVSLYNSDKALATQQFNERSGILNMVLANQTATDKANTSSYQSLVKTFGYGGLLDGLSGDPNAVALAEKSLGLAPGGLAQLAIQQAGGLDGAQFYKTPSSSQVFDASTNQPIDLATYKQMTGQTDTPDNQVNFDGIKTLGASSAADNKLLTVAEAKSLGVPYGTTVGQAKGITPGKKTGGAPKTTLKEDVGSMKSQLETVKGQDGYLSPEDYKTAQSAWQKAGYSAASFKTNFQNYINPADPQDYK